MAYSLDRLTNGEVTVLYWKCRGMQYEEIRTKLRLAKGTVQFRMSRVYAKLGFEKKMHWSKRVEILEREICPLLPKNLNVYLENRRFSKEPEQEIEEIIEEENRLELIAYIFSNEEEKVSEIAEGTINQSTKLPTDKEPEATGQSTTVDEPKTQPKPKLDPEMLALVIYDEKKSLEIIKKEPEIIIYPPPPPPNYWRLYILGTLFVITICAVGYFAYTFGRGSTPPPVVIVVTATPLPANETPPITDTPVATDTPIATLTFTSVPTFTALPTHTPLPPISLPFSDNFSNGVTLPWTVVSGKWIVESTGATITIMDGDNPTGAIKLEDPTMTNYRLRVDVHSPHVLSANQGGLAVVVRYRSDHDQNLAFYMNSSSRFAWGYLSTLSDLDFYLPPITSVTNANIISDFVLEIEVQGNNFVARVDGEKYDSFTMSGYETGGIALVTLCGNVGSCPSFSNLSLEPLP